MALTVNDFSDLIHIIETHPEWRQKLRQVLFPEIDIPQAFQRLTAIIERLDAQMGIGFAEAKTERDVIKQDVGVLKQDVGVLKQDVGVLKQDVGILKQDVGVLKQDVGILKQDVRTLKGRSHEQFYQDKAEAIFGRYLRGGKLITAAIADRLQEALDVGQISDAEYEQVLAADLLWGGQIRQTKDEVVLVLEASWLAETTDVIRAVTRAAILRRIGLKALPVVAGREWTKEAVELALKQKAVRTENGRVDPASWQVAVSDLK